MELVNEYAPEHLILCVENYLEQAKRVMNAGSVFLGNYSPESARGLCFGDESYFAHERLCQSV